MAASHPKLTTLIFIIALDSILLQAVHSSLLEPEQQADRRKAPIPTTHSASKAVLPSAPARKLPLFLSTHQNLLPKVARAPASYSTGKPHEVPGWSIDVHPRLPVPVHVAHAPASKSSEHTQMPQLSCFPLEATSKGSDHAQAPQRFPLPPHETAFKRSGHAHAPRFRRFRLLPHETTS